MRKRPAGLPTESRAEREGGIGKEVEVFEEAKNREVGEDAQQQKGPTLRGRCRSPKRDVKEGEQNWEHDGRTQNPIVEWSRARLLENLLQHRKAGNPNCGQTRDGEDLRWRTPLACNGQAAEVVDGCRRQQQRKKAGVPAAVKGVARAE